MLEGLRKLIIFAESIEVFKDLHFLWMILRVDFAA